MSGALTVVKVGGSLYDMPGVGKRLCAWLACEVRTDVLLVPGGGAAADLVRDLDRLNGLGEETSHGLALRSLTFTAHLVAALLSPWRPALFVSHPAAARAVARTGRVAVLDMAAFARADEGRPGSLPHRWSVTSDSLAARAAQVAEADALVLLKSVTIPLTMTWEEAAERGFVDAAFPSVVERGPRVRAVNLRTWDG